MKPRSRRPNGIRSRKISVSVSDDDFRVLTARAKRLYRGNLSAVVHEMAAAVKREEAADELLAMLGGDRISDSDMAEIRAEVAAAPLGRRKRATPA